MKLSEREWILFLATAMAALFGGSAMLAKPKLEAWRELQQQQAEIGAQIEQDRELVEQTAKWERDFGELSEMLSEHPADKKMDIYWLAIMDNIAARHGVNISKRQVGEEKKVGDVYELPIDCNDWEGTLSALVHFLFDLQDEGAMLDIRQLYIKPKQGNVLRGRFSLYCAYTRAAAGE